MNLGKKKKKKSMKFHPCNISLLLLLLLLLFIFTANVLLIDDGGTKIGHNTQITYMTKKNILT
jgi:hypothetical protein